MSNYFSCLNHLAPNGLASASHSFAHRSSLALSDLTTGNLITDGPCSWKHQSKLLCQLTSSFRSNVTASRSSLSYLLAAAAFPSCHPLPTPPPPSPLHFRCRIKGV